MYPFRTGTKVVRADGVTLSDMSYDKESLADWVSRIAHGQSNRTIAGHIDVHHQALSRWLSKGQMPAPQVVEIAHRYDADALEGLRLAGYITEGDIRRGAAGQALREASDTDLVDELHRRTHARVVEEVVREELARGVHTGEQPTIRITT